MNYEDKQFMKQFMIVLGALVAFTVVIFFLARFLMYANTPAKEESAFIRQYEEERLKPVGEIATGKAPQAAAPVQKAAGKKAAGGKPPTGAGASASGESTYQSACAACHDSGAAGAPMLTDNAAWKPRIKQGKQTLYKHAITGFGAMPPKGGDPSLSDAQVKAAVDYIVAQVSGSGAAAEQQPAQAPAKGERTQTKRGKAGQASQSAAPAEGAANQQPARDRSQTAGGEAGRQDQAQAAPAGGETLAMGKKIFESTCSACHIAGIANAPKLGDKAAWKPRLAQGEGQLYESAISGMGAMPPKGGNPSLTSKQVKAAVDYMLNAVQ